MGPVWNTADKYTFKRSAQSQHKHIFFDIICTRKSSMRTHATKGLFQNVTIKHTHEQKRTNSSAWTTNSDCLLKVEVNANKKTLLGLRHECRIVSSVIRPRLRLLCPYSVTRTLQSMPGRIWIALYLPVGGSIRGLVFVSARRRGFSAYTHLLVDVSECCRARFLLLRASTGEMQQPK